MLSPGIDWMDVWATAFGRAGLRFHLISLLFWTYVKISGKMCSGRIFWWDIVETHGWEIVSRQKEKSGNYEEVVDALPAYIYLICNYFVADTSFWNEFLKASLKAHSSVTRQVSKNQIRGCLYKLLVNFKVKYIN